VKRKAVCVEVGDVVLTPDEDALGTVQEKSGTHLVVEPHASEASPLFIPSTAIPEQAHADKTLWLNLTGEEIRQRGWAEPPDLAAPAAPSAVEPSGAPEEPGGGGTDAPEG
jgi:hypothetical protein